MIGETLYGLTAVSYLQGGDGARLWREFGFQKDLSVPFSGLLGLATIPSFLAIGWGVAKGVYKAYIAKDSNNEQNV